MKPFTRSAGWFRSRLLPRIRKGEPLTLASVWILCTSCSFNNNFQDGCLGTIRIIVPENKHGAAGRGKKPHKRSTQLEFRTKSTPDQLDGTQPEGAQAERTIVVTSPSNGLAFAQQASKAALQLISMNWKRWEQGAPIERSKNPLSLPAPPKPPSLPEPPLLFQYPARQIQTQLPGVLKMLFWEEEAELPKSKVPTLRNGEPNNVWQERPETIRLCFHTEDANPGWMRFHTPRNTYQVQQHCRPGHALGSGRHWFVIDDTFAASASPCRVFFSPGRAYIVAQCGSTIYRNSIRRAARCLQIGRGAQCTYPQARLHKMPTDHKQSVEWQAPVRQ